MSRHPPHARGRWAQWDGLAPISPHQPQEQQQQVGAQQGLLEQRRQPLPWGPSLLSHGGLTEPVFPPHSPQNQQQRQDSRGNPSNALATDHRFTLQGRVSQKPKMGSELLATPKKFISRGLESQNSKSQVGELTEERTDTANGISMRYS